MTTIDRDGLRIAAAYYSGGDYTRNAGISWDEVLNLLDGLEQAEAQAQANALHLRRAQARIQAVRDEMDKWDRDSAGYQRLAATIRRACRCADLDAMDAIRADRIREEMNR